jgi:DNA-binding SARP family transcriptional activator/DNA polymerase III delta prime subunit
MELTVLGPFQVADGPRNLTPTAPKLRQVLALLAIRSGQVVLTSALVEELWGQNPPRSASTTLQTYIYQLRRVFASAENPDAGLRLLITKPFGYAAQFDPARIDVQVFEARAKAGGKALADGDDEVAASQLGEALALWHGPAFSDVVTGSILERQATRLEEAFLHTLELRIEADLRLGRHRELISELKALIAEHPLNEGLHAKLMLCLYRADRRFEAIDVYGRLRRSLVGELGLEPSRSLRQLHQALLAGDSWLEGPPRRTSAGNLVVPTVPAQLPADIGDFVARQEEHQIRGLLEHSERTAMPIAVVSGPPGTGKTALAVHAAHKLRKAFPDGQFYADLRGRDAAPAHPGEVLAQFLTAVGVKAADLPAGLEGRSQMFRTWAADRRVLILLDDAARSSQVRPLLPGGAGCGAIVTGRTMLTDLPGAVTVPLQELDQGGALALMKSVVGERRVAAELPAVERLVRTCGYVPLALRAAGIRLAAKPHWSFRRLAAKLEEADNMLDELRIDDLDVMESIAWSVHRLDADERHVLHEVSGLPPDGFTLQQAAGVLEIGRIRVEHHLERLRRANLIEVRAGDDEHQDSYRLWPLVRHFIASARRHRVNGEPVEAIA